MTNGNPSETNPGFGVQGLNFARVEAMFAQLTAAIARSRDAPADTAAAADAALRAEYQTAVEMVKLLSDIRFRCLTFVTAVIAVANALLPGTGAPGVRIILGFVGFLTTLGIAVYELRNSQLYEAATHRAKQLEVKLRAVRTSGHSPEGGLFNERPLYVTETYGKGLTAEGWAQAKKEGPLMRFWRVDVKHDRGLALIYGAVLGGWLYMVADSLLSLPPPLGLWPPAPGGLHHVAPALIALAAFAFSYKQLVYHDKNRFRPEPPANN